ncbi:nuclear transport factor 2 family protein [Deinococcus humi]|uniref:Ketosteroid isomerase-like protein n=1 Tax=Deinococcus humi TaxID=662880 RepID=A0A7W8NDG0_9DEIO|nr:nuclear transport factor 2 family protein [Deinococcus humi]MBB5361575.1 ketosteroid isomerase-like protein [Deinococcus humi]GGO20788.1 epoxide hydrolase [Deinococcus humi]
MTTTEEFMSALQNAEASKDPSGLVALHAGDVTLSNLTTKTWQGMEGAQAFWESYLSDFQEIRSEFTHHHESDGQGVMEWNARGKLKNGDDIEYRGVSIIEIKDGKVGAFRTYYDSAAFVSPAQE